MAMQKELDFVPKRWTSPLIRRFVKNTNSKNGGCRWTFVIIQLYAPIYDGSQHGGTILRHQGNLNLDSLFAVLVLGGQQCGRLASDHLDENTPETPNVRATADSARRERILKGVNTVGGTLLKRPPGDCEHRLDPDQRNYFQRASAPFRAHKMDVVTLQQIVANAVPV